MGASIPTAPRHVSLRLKLTVTLLPERRWHKTCWGTRHGGTRHGQQSTVPKANQQDSSRGGVHAALCHSTAGERNHVCTLLGRIEFEICRPNPRPFMLLHTATLVKVQ